MASSTRGGRAGAASRSRDAQCLDARALNRALLARQSLIERSDESPLAMIERLVGLQAQAPNPPYLGLWTRLREFRLEQLSEAMQARRVVRATMMRGTLHLVSVADYRALRPALQPMLQRLSLQSGHARALNGLELASVREAGRAALRGTALSAKALGEALRARWPGHDTGELALLVRGAEPVVHVPPAGIWDEHAPARFALASDWLGTVIDEDGGDEATDALLLRYLGAFGPASARDAAVWSGLNGTRERLERLRPRLWSGRDEAGIELFDLPEAPRPDPSLPAPPRLLPEFDNVLLAHAERARIFDAQRRGAIFTRNGLVAATFLVDGFVAGTWKLQRSGDSATATIAPFASRLPSEVRAALEREALDCMAAAAPECARHEVRFLAAQA
ncbi:winged helix DNA-binding domain-containing protein [Lysobacter sp. BMK333-48F3]|uniref:winged helix DNA-binding domain-containing protein n=1 Tax=Lysobacter sp. BMK333-48F3 TaxID=2867962 RepID=UPI001C8B8408|nr:winged helix DNA-binding domain-containing protein [Lysobacter sp. BMK333-48F3]MBX9400238.1 winged helix DNA-binding domain-containing protein [Lysobacter sp. BMK333-48F3]